MLTQMGQIVPGLSITNPKARSRIALLPGGEPIEADQLFEAGAPQPPSDGDRAALVAALEATSGNIVQTAKRLSSHPRQIYRWIEKHGLSLDDYRKRR